MNFVYSRLFQIIFVMLIPLSCSKDSNSNKNIIEDPFQSPIESDASIKETERIIQEAKKQLKAYWKFD